MLASKLKISARSVYNLSRNVWLPISEATCVKKSFDRTPFCVLKEFRAETVK